MTIEQDAVFGEPPDCLGEGLGLRVLAYLDKLALRVAVFYTSDVLFYDRTLVEILSHKVCCGTN